MEDYEAQCVRCHRTTDAVDTQGRATDFPLCPKCRDFLSPRPARQQATEAVGKLIASSRGGGRR
jgi:hypothetical protein